MDMTLEQALAHLPPLSKCTATFGYPGEGGYVEHHEARDGQRYRVTNGPWDARPPFEWTVEKVPAP